MLKLLKLIKDLLARRQETSYQKLVAAFRSRHKLSEKAATEVVKVYLEELCKTIESGGQLVVLDQEAMETLGTMATGDHVQVDLEKLLNSDLVNKTVTKLAKKP